MTKRWIALCVLLCGWVAAPAFGQALADRLPKDAIAYVGWAGTDALTPAYKQSLLKGVVDAGDFPAIVKNLLDQAMTKASAAGQDAKDKAALVHDLVKLLLMRPTAFYFGGLDLADPRSPMPRVALLCQSGPAGAPLVDRCTQLLEKTPQARNNVTIKMLGDTLFIGAGSYDTIEAYVQANHPPADSLAATSEFRAGIAQIQKDQALTAFLNVDSLLQLIQDQAAVQNPQGAALLQSALAAAGVTAIHSATFADGFAGKEWSRTGFIHMDKERKTLTALLDTKPLSPDALAMIPPDATFASIVQFDGPRLLADIRANPIVPNEAEILNNAIHQGSLMLGTDLESGVLAALGNEWILYASPEPAGSPLPGVTIINKLKNPAAFEKSYKALQDMATGLLALQGMRGGKALEIKDTPVADYVIHSIAAGPVTPAWTISGNYFVISLTSQGVQSALEQLAPGKSNLSSNPTFAARRQAMAVPAASTLTYADLSKLAPEVYALILQGRAFITPDAEKQGWKLPELPPYEKIKPFMTSTMAVSWSDEAGWHSKEMEPFYGVELLGDQGVFSGTLASSIFLPAINRARFRAQGVKGVAQLHTVSMALMTYSTNHNGALPADLGQLVKEGLAAPRVFVYPGTDIPADVDTETASLETRAAWVNAHTSYQYTGGGKKFSDIKNPSQTPVAFDKPDAQNNAAQLSVLYADGHVELRDRKEVETLAANK